MKEKETLTPLKDIIASLLSGRGLPFSMEDGRIWTIWPKAVKGLSQCASPVSFKKGTLFVEVSEPIWMQELSFLENDIKARLNHCLDGDVVKRIEFRLKCK